MVVAGVFGRGACGGWAGGFGGVFPSCGGMPVFFGRVNQVLVRFWARRGRKSDRMDRLREGAVVPRPWRMRSETCV